MTKRLRVASVGAGYFARFHYEAWSRIGEVELVGCADRNLEKAGEVARTYGVPATFSDAREMLGAVRPDVLDIVVPPEGHLELIRLAAERGIDVICQKPFCRTLEEAVAAMQLARAAPIRLIVHENFRFQPWHREIKRQIEAGRLGEIYQITFRLRPGDGQGPRAYLDRQPYFQKMPRFLVHETAIHLIDVFRFLLGEVEAVYADLRQLNPAITGEDAGIILFDFASGARGVFDGNRLADHKATNRRRVMGEMLVEGSAGSLTLDGDGNLRFRAHASNEEVQVSYAWSDHTFAGDCVFLLQTSIARALRTGASVENSAEDYLANIVIEEAVYRSSASGVKSKTGTGPI